MEKEQFDKHPLNNHMLSTPGEHPQPIPQIAYHYLQSNMNKQIRYTYKSISLHVCKIIEQKNQFSSTTAEPNLYMIWYSNIPQKVA